MTPTRRLPVTTSELDALAFLVRLSVAVNVAIPPIHALLTEVRTYTGTPSPRFDLRKFKIDGRFRS